MRQHDMSPYLNVVCDLFSLLKEGVPCFESRAKSPFAGLRRPPASVRRRGFSALGTTAPSGWAVKPRLKFSATMR